MKKALWLGILLSFLFASHSFAAVTLSLQEKNNTINATLNGANASSSYRLLIQTTPFPSGNPTTYPKSIIAYSPADPTIRKPDAQGTIVWSLSELYNTTYYIQALEIPASIAITPEYSAVQSIKTDQITLYFSHLITTVDGNNIDVQGRIDPTKQPDYKNYTIYLIVSKSKDMSNPIDPGLRSSVSTFSGAPFGISDGHGGDENDAPGKYYWVLSDLIPGKTYYMQQKIVKDVNDTVFDRVETLDSTNGIVINPASGSTATSGTAPNSYKLLSDNTGQTVMPDPALCAQQQAAATASGKTPPPCSINDYLNLAMKILIGLCAVVLVLRLMFEGYQYMVTDVPFLKASAKSGFFTALLGLLLALSSYVILNTINPKLVSETVNVQQLTIGVAGDDGLGVPGTSSGNGNATNKSGGPVSLSLKSGGTVSVPPCDTSQLTTVSIFGQTGVQVQKNLAPSLQRISAAWQNTNPKYPVTVVEGYNCRDIASLNTLSYHSYGLAIDINPDSNAVGTAGDIPQSFINLWKAEGWGWGGNWTSKKDPMHFSKGTNEGGNMQGE